MKSLILLSGAAAVGKTSVCDTLRTMHSFEAIKSSDYLKAIAKAENSPVTRDTLQEIGDRLDIQTNFEWLLYKVAVPQILANPIQLKWYVDSVRKRKQVELFKAEYPTAATHIHLTSNEETLRGRFEARTSSSGSGYEKTYEQHIKHSNEISSRQLIEIADAVIDCSTASLAAICEEIINHRGIL